ncbi:hypothetical protein [Dyella sp.]
MDASEHTLDPIQAFDFEEEFGLFKLSTASTSTTIFLLKTEQQV